MLLSSDEWKILSTYSSYDFEIKLTHRVAEAGWILELSQGKSSKNAVPNLFMSFHFLTIYGNHWRGRQRKICFLNNYNVA